MLFFIIIILSIFVLIGLISYIVYRNTYNIKHREGSLDSFGRERISESFTLSDYKNIYGNNIDFNNKTNNGGSITELTNKSSIRLSVSSGQIGSAIHQTKRYHNYMPGKSQLLFASFIFYNAKKNVTKRIGYFDDDNGIFFEQNGEGILSFNIRSKTSGTTKIEESINQKNWNKNKFNSIDINKTQLLYIDFQWLGVGKVRCGFIIDDDYILCHTFYHSNKLNKAFMSNPNLPFRCEISNINSQEDAYFDQICSTVISEGGYNNSGRDWSFGRDTALTLNNTNDTSLIAIKLKNSFNGYDNRITVRLGNISLLTDEENIFYKILRVIDSSSITETGWTSVNDNSGVEYNISNNMNVPNTGIYQIKSGYITGGGRKGPEGGISTNTPTTAKQNYIVQNFDSNNSEAYLIVIKRLGNTDTNVFASMDWREIY